MKNLTGNDLNTVEEIKIIYQTYFTEYPDLLNIQQVCELFGGVGKKSIYSLIKNKKIKYCKIGKEYRISKIHLLEYLGIIEKN